MLLRAFFLLGVITFWWATIADAIENKALEENTRLLRVRHLAVADNPFPAALDSHQLSNEEENPVIEGETPIRKLVGEIIDPAGQPFLMPIEDVFTIPGRGTVVTGRVEQGVLRTGDELEIVGLNGANRKTTCTAIETFRQLVDRAQPGDNIGVVVRGVNREDVQRGQVLCAVNRFSAHTQFDADIYVLAKEEGGRQTPFFSQYRPQFRIRTADVSGVVTLKAGTEMVMPGDSATVHVQLIAPVVINEGLRFVMQEGGKTVASGIVRRVTE